MRIKNGHDLICRLYCHEEENYLVTRRSLLECDFLKSLVTEKPGERGPRSISTKGLAYVFDIKFQVGVLLAQTGENLIGRWCVSSTIAPLHENRGGSTCLS